MKYALVIWWALIATVVMTATHPVATKGGTEGTKRAKEHPTISMCMYLTGPKACPII